MVYWKYIKANDETDGGNWNSNNISRLLHILFCDKGPIRVEADAKDDYINHHQHWVYHIYMENGDWAWLQCTSRKVFDKIHDDVMKLDGKKIWFNGTFMIYETVKR